MITTPSEPGYVRVPKGHLVIPKAGDTILVKNNTFISWLIRIGESLRFRYNTWSHAAMAIDDEGTISEALWRGVRQDNIAKYKRVEYMIVRTSENVLSLDEDKLQAFTYLRGQLDKPYGYLTLVGTATRFLIPGHNFAFISSANICSGLAAQALTRGSFYPDLQPVSMSPADLANALGVSQS